MKRHLFSENNIPVVIAFKNSTLFQHCLMNFIHFYLQWVFGHIMVLLK